MIYPVVLNPCLDRSIFVPKIVLDQVIRTDRVRLDWGGKGNNVGRALSLLEVPCVVMGFAGGMTGQLMQRGLSAAGVKNDFIRVAGETRTNYVFQETEDSHYFKVNEIGPTISPKEQSLFLDKIRKVTTADDIWVFSGRLPNGVPEDYYALCIDEVNKKGGRAFLDTSGQAFRLGCKKIPYLIKPNLEELEEFIGKSLLTEEEIYSTIEGIIATGIRVVIVSNGARQIYFATKEEFFRIQPPSVPVKNVIGAGDSLVAGILFGLYHDLPFEQMAKWGVACGTASVMNEQVGIVSREEVEKVYSSYQFKIENDVRKRRTNPVLPGYLLTSEEGSFARHTIVERKPKIIESIIADNQYPSTIEKKLLSFRSELKEKTISPISGRGWDKVFWNNELEKYYGKTWLEVPWFFAETFFYRKLLDIIGYDTENGRFSKKDPFEIQKIHQIEKDIEQLEREWDFYPEYTEENAFSFYLHASLWGNRADLSNKTVDLINQYDIAGKDDSHLVIIDDTDEVFSLIRRRVDRIDFITDNVGRELIFDLILADFLLTAGFTQFVVINLKKSPYFVSDAMPKDVEITLDRMLSSSCNKIIQIARNIRQWLQKGSLRLEDSFFWSSFYMFDDLPLFILDELEKSSLIFLKGDANYRRILGDRHWDFTEAIQNINLIFPRPYVLLRTFKSEVAVNLSQDQIDLLMNSDPKWLINGRRGVIQLVK